MNILIVENEKPAAEKIVRLLEKIDRSLTIAGIVETVEGAINQLQNEAPPDLILMDIQLDDGLCFEIFETIGIDIPVIFTTAYDEYMLKAFKVNSVDYLLKPVEEDALRNAINKFKSLHDKAVFKNDMIMQLIRELNAGFKNRFLVKIGPRYRSVPVGEISCFYISGRVTFIRTFADKEYAIDYSLDYILKSVDYHTFFRINRNCMVNINAISDILFYSSSRLKIKLNSNKPMEDLIVSRDKVHEFKKWIDK
jgi:DNA-binding LytR/AlgR family response regulator